MVKPSYFTGKYYLSQQRWAALWGESFQVDYPPVVDVRTVKPMKDSDNPMLGAVLELFKYAVKPSDLMGDMTGEIRDEDRDWLVEFTLQTKGTRAIATGGLLKSYLRELESEPDDLIHVDEEGETEDNPNSPSVIFDYMKDQKMYLLREDEIE
jgi:hypothetical protein